MNDLQATIFENKRLGESYRKYTHPSGLDIYIFPKKMTTYYAIFGTRYGSIHNRFKFENENAWILGAYVANAVTRT